MTKGLNMTNNFNKDRTAVIVVDLQQENLGHGYWPVQNYALVLDRARMAIKACRSAGLPIIYTRHWLNPLGWDAHSGEELDATGRPVQSVAGTKTAEICPEVAPSPEDLVIDKQRFTAFYGTKLDLVLRRMDIRHLIIFGVWTEACLETTVWDALWRDYRLTLVHDACGSSTDTVHKTAILDMANWLYGGHVIRAAELAKALAGDDYQAWIFRKPNSMPYTLETLDSLYASIDNPDQ
jgi:nicotinamidase-related amidase